MSVSARGIGAASILLLVGTLGIGLVAVMGCGRTAAGPPGGPRLSFQEQARNFGRISASQPSQYQFPFSNTGDSTLEISDVRPEPPRPGT